MLQEADHNNPASDVSVSPSSDVVSSNLTVQERQLELTRASRQYLNGEISEERLNEVEAELEVDYAKALLDQTSVFSEVASVIKRWVSGLRRNGSGKK
ncbi:MAG: hypothetical protein AAFQ40_11810 [Cyanobacteria bacterium J06623_5]